jgi:hypothetical protein
MKPKTHVYLAEIALQDALQDGKVTIYATDYANGAVGSSLGDFAVDTGVLAALRSNAAQFRAGVLGPDAYPDIATGQEVIHPAGRDTPGQPKGVDINMGGPGSDPWLEYLYSRAFNSRNPADQTAANQAFVLGYLAHAAADMYAHTLINYYAGGPFHFTPTPENAIKHMVMEGYIEKRTPALASYDAGIGNGVDQFIYRNMIDADRNAYLGQRLLKGSGTEYSMPAKFSTLRGELREYIQANESSWNPVTVLKVKYNEAWVEDIDEGLAALPQMSDQLAKALFFNPGGMDSDKAKQIAKAYGADHLLSMAGAPDAVGVVVGTVFNVVAFVAGLIAPIKDAIDAMERDLLNYLLMGAFGMTVDQIENYAKNPGTYFEQGALNTGTGQHIDIQTFNAQQLHISDPGNTNPNEYFDAQKFAAAYNAVTMIKLELMSQSEVNRLLQILTQNYDPGNTAPVLSQPNVMLGFMETLDGSNQWNANPSKMVFAQNPKLYQRIFMQQAGEVVPLSPQRIELVAAAASSQLTAEYNGKPQTADRLLEDNQDGTHWNSDDTGKDPIPWFWVELCEPSIVTEFRIRWKEESGTVGARAMKYNVLTSLDGKTWSDSGRSQADVADLSPSLDQDKLLGWPSPTLFIKVAMSDSSYGAGAYFTCHGVEVWGVPAQAS